MCTDVQRTIEKSCQGQPPSAASAWHSVCESRSPPSTLVERPKSAGSYTCAVLSTTGLPHRGLQLPGAIYCHHWNERVRKLFLRGAKTGPKLADTLLERCKTRRWARRALCRWSSALYSFARFNSLHSWMVEVWHDNGQQFRNKFLVAMERRLCLIVHTSQKSGTRLASQIRSRRHIM